MRIILFTFTFIFPCVSLANLDANDVLVLLEAGKSPLNTLWVKESRLYLKPQKPIQVESLPRENINCSFEGDEFMLALPSSGKVTKTHNSVYRIVINQNDHFMLVDVSKNRKQIAKIPKKEKGDIDTVKRFNTVANLLNNDIRNNYKNDYEYIKYTLEITPGKFKNITNNETDTYNSDSNLYEDLDTLLRLITKFYSVPPETTKIVLIESPSIDSIVYYLGKKNATVINIFIGDNSFELVLGETVNINKVMRLIGSFLPKGGTTNRKCDYEKTQHKIK